ncbi:MAG TPA: response regulator [Victivallis vadensis]|nr:response regulator [Victivallis vadensis]
MFSASGAAALEILKREQPGVILTDLWMPGMSGIELVEHLTGDPRWKQIPVIAVTADVQIAAEKRAFTDLLLKPITLDSLREVLGRTLRAYP